MGKIVFQHIPKTGGCTISSILLSNVESKAVFICGVDGVLVDFMNLRQESRDAFSYLSGHVFYGIHELFSEPVRYFTFLREPIDRTISHYFFIKSTPSHRYHADANRFDLEEFILSGIRPKMNNCMCRMISGIDAPYNKCTSEMFDQALRNIRSHYCFVGFLESFFESVRRLSIVLGWDNTDYRPKNQAKRRPSKDQLSESELRVIKEYNALDIELYNHLLGHSGWWGYEKVLE